MQFKTGDTVVPLSQGQEQSPPQKLKAIHEKDGQAVYELEDGSRWTELAPGDKRTWALVTLRHGWSVIPLMRGDKIPIVEWEAYQSAPPDEETVNRWFQIHPDANYGIVAGAVSGIIILDIDGPKGEQYARDHGGLPETPTATSGKGRHIYFKHPGYKVNNRVFRDLELDVRADGGQAVGAGSWHAKKQKTYRWLKDPWTTPLADAPLWLLELVEKKNGINSAPTSNNNDNYIEAAFSGELATLARTQEGERNDQLNRSAFNLGQLVGSGALDESKVRTSLFAVGTAIGLSDKEARATIESGIEKGKQQPRYVPEREYDELPPLPQGVPASLLGEKYRELQDADDKAQSFRDMTSLLAATDPFTAETYIDQIANDGIANKTVTRKAIKQVAQQQKAQAKQQQRPNPTHDELGDRWISQNGDLTIYVYEKWYRYRNGIWKPTEKVETEVWDVLIAAKSEGVRPTRNIKVSVIDYMQNQCRKADETMNSSPNLVCMQNGVFDLDNLELLDYDPEHYMTSKLEFGYDESAECPLWQETILDWMSENEEAVAHLQEAVGYSLTGDTKYQMAWMLAGEGSNGKDTFLEILRALVGDNASHELDLSALSVDDRYGLANLPNKKIVTCAEAVSDRPVADTYFKKIISGEPMEARMPYGKPFNFRPICKIWWSVNDKPLVTDQTKGYWRRWTVVPFEQSYLGREDFELEDKLKKELPGIFNWAIEGLIRLEKNQMLTPVLEFTEATEEYRHKTSVESLFVEEACETNPLMRTAIKTAYAQYRTYCAENGYHAKGKRRFVDDMVRIGYPRTRLNDKSGTRALQGFTVKDQLLWD